MSARRTVAILALAAWLAACYCAPAEAAFKPFELASASPLVQAEYAYEPAVSADGRYLAFTGVVGSQSGVYRKDLLTRELVTVALGEATGAPSISGDGRYVSFTSGDEPSTGKPTLDGCTQVYVRDMEEGYREPQGSEGLANQAGEFRLASARDGSEAPLTYDGTGKEGCPGGGSASSARLALSADGTKVAFTTIGVSDLDGGSPTPAGQVAVRDLATDATSLVSVTEGASPAPVPGGAALSAMPRVAEVQAKGVTERVGEEAGGSAAISADGKVVAWMGINVRAQTGQSVKTSQYPLGYAEPLWRRIADGSAAPTRSVLAGDEPAAPGCPQECLGGLDLQWDEQDLDFYEGRGPEFGSYVAKAEPNGFQGDSIQDVTPQLSADGREVAILSTQPDSGHRPNFGQLSPRKVPTANAFVVNMAQGLTRAQAITRLTEWASPEFERSETDGALSHLALSGDGTRVLFATQRTNFPLAPPALITAPLGQAQAATQLYEVNLQAGTLALVSEGYNHEPANFEEGSGGVGQAALSADGGLIALASGSSNLAYGSVNAGSAVYVTGEEGQRAEAGHQSIGALPAWSNGEAAWNISATVRRGPGGALLIDVSVPSAGRLTASASASVPAKPALPGQARGGALRARRGRGSKAPAHAPGRLAARVVARAAALAGSEGVLELRLAPMSAYRSLTSSKAGLYATILVRFSPPGHPALSATLQASFPRSRNAPKPRARAKRKGGSRA